MDSKTVDGIQLLLSTVNILSVTMPPEVLSNDNTSNLENFISFASPNFYRTNIKETEVNQLKDELNGAHLRIASMEDYPLSYSKTINGTKVGQGVVFQLLDFLTNKFNFTYNLTFPNKNIYGSTNDMEGSLISIINEIDMAAAFIPILADARKHVTYSTTTLDEGEWIMIMLRPTESATGSGLLAPFDRNVWILILVSLLAVGPIIYGLIMLRYKLTKDTNQKNYPLPHCIWFVYGALMKQGSTLSPIADSTRLLFATWWIFITILTSFYTANLTAFLTLSKFTLPINNVEDIIRKDKHFVSHRGGCIEYAIKNDNESLTQLNQMVINSRALFIDNKTDAQSLNEYVEKKGYVFVRDRPAIDHLIYDEYRKRKTISATDEKIHCPFAVSKTPFLKRKRAFAYPMNTKWNRLFDPELLHLVESGIIKYMLLDHLPNVEICPQNLGGTERQLRNGDLLMTYYIMIAGFCTSIAVFLSEVFFRLLISNGNNIQKITDNNDSSGKRINGYTKESISITPPPPYAALYDRNKLSNEFLAHSPWRNEIAPQYINGRNYMVFKNQGASRLIPMRTPSARLFQFTYSK